MSTSTLFLFGSLLSSVEGTDTLGRDVFASAATTHVTLGGNRKKPWLQNGAKTAPMRPTTRVGLLPREPKKQPAASQSGGWLSGWWGKKNPSGRSQQEAFVEDPVADRRVQFASGATTGRAGAKRRGGRQQHQSFAVDGAGDEDMRSRTRNARGAWATGADNADIFSDAESSNSDEDVSGAYVGPKVQAARDRDASAFHTVGSSGKKGGFVFTPSGQNFHTVEEGDEYDEAQQTVVGRYISSEQESQERTIPHALPGAVISVRRLTSAESQELPKGQSYNFGGYMEVGLTKTVLISGISTTYNYPATFTDFNNLRRTLMEIIGEDSVNQGFPGGWRKHFTPWNKSLRERRADELHIWLDRVLRHQDSEIRKSLKTAFEAWFMKLQRKYDPNLRAGFEYEADGSQDEI